MTSPAPVLHAGPPRRGRACIRPTRDAADIAAWLEMARKVREKTDDGLPYDEDLLRRAFESRLGKDNCCVLQAELEGRLVGGSPARRGRISIRRRSAPG